MFINSAKSDITYKAYLHTQEIKCFHVNCFIYCCPVTVCQYKDFDAPTHH
jgi:hypothetical protein